MSKSKKGQLKDFSHNRPTAVNLYYSISATFKNMYLRFLHYISTITLLDIVTRSACNHLYYLHKYCDHPYNYDNTAYQTTNDAVKCQHPNAPGNSNIFRDEEHTHFPNPIGKTYHNPEKEVIKSVFLLSYRITHQYP